MHSPSTSRQGRLRLRVTAAAESAVRMGHPWVFADSIREANREGELGEIAVIYDRRDRFLAFGLFDPESPLRVRILHCGRPVEVSPDWWRDRLLQAIGLRRELFGADTNGYRWIHGESDGWPGLVLDRYAGTVVLKLYTAAWLPRLDAVFSLLQSELTPERIVLRLSRNIQSTAHRCFHRQDGEILTGPGLDSPVTFLESGLTFEADVLRGQKTGFFLDQRENRRLVATLAGGRRVLNAFSFSGGFSLYAARGGACSVTDLDISAHALAAAGRNIALNRSDSGVAACRHEMVQADAFDWLKAARRGQFDLVILDPPSLAKREGERAGAIHAYTRLAGHGMGVLRPGGILVAASCSAHVSAPEFFEAVMGAAARAEWDFEELRRTEHPPDHPSRFAEARYLKCIYLRCIQPRR